MSEKQDTILIDGLFFELPSDNAPTFVKGKLSINVAKLTQFLKDNQNSGGYVNIDLKQSKSGNGYSILNTWKPEHKQFKEDKPKDIHVDTEVEYPEENINPDDIPF